METPVLFVDIWTIHQSFTGAFPVYSAPEPFAMDPTSKVAQDRMLVRERVALQHHNIHIAKKIFG